MLKIHCKDNWCKALELSCEHYDKTFGDCMLRVMNYFAWKDVKEVNIYNDYDENCFYFTVVREDNSMAMNGGIIFHGFPETGYLQNGSVQLEKRYGWSIHT